MSGAFAVIGDLVGSRRLESRSATHDALVRVLTQVSHSVPPVDRLEITVGDEFQGVFETFADASLAALAIRLRLSGGDGSVDVRCGLGYGEREVLQQDRTPMVQDGPAWWSARAAIDVLGTSAGRQRRTWFDDSYSDDTMLAAPIVNAYLVTRDALVDRLNPRAREMLLLSLAGSSQRAIAQELGVSESAVSQAFAKGVSAVRDAQQMISELSNRR